MRVCAKNIKTIKTREKNLPIVRPFKIFYSGTIWDENLLNQNPQIFIWVKGTLFKLANAYKLINIFGFSYRIKLSYFDMCSDWYWKRSVFKNSWHENPEVSTVYIFLDLRLNLPMLASRPINSSWIYETSDGITLFQFSSKMCEKLY